MEYYATKPIVSGVRTVAEATGRSLTHFVSRREFLQYLAYLSMYGLMESLALVSTINEAETMRYNYRELKIPDLSDAADGMLVVHTSDWHMGDEAWSFINPSTIGSICIEIQEFIESNASSPQKVVLVSSGDAITTNGTQSSRPNHLFTGLKAMEKIPAAYKIVVPGNHDLNHPLAHDMITMLNEFGGFEILGYHDKFISKQHLPFQVLGTPDYTYSPGIYDQQYLDGVAQAINTKEFSILLTHNASIMDRLGLMHQITGKGISLHGHTHGGQVGGHTIMQRAVQAFALASIGYDSRFIDGTTQLANDFYLNVNPAMGYSSSHMIRTAFPAIDFFKLCKI